MRFMLFSIITNATWAAVRHLWEHVDRTGWDGACLSDHFMPNTPDRVGETLECWTTLASLATVVPRMRIGTLVAGNTYRHPAVLAKMAANVDVVTGGRLICGIGAGWQENEHVAYGLPFYTVGERLARLDEACEVLKLLWTRERASFAGRYYQLSDAPLAPKPVQQPHPELMIGGGGEKVTLRIAAQHADHWNVWGGPETLARKIRILDEHCARIGRAPRAIVRSANLVLRITDDRAEADRVVRQVMERFGRTEAEARDWTLVGSVAEIQDKLARLREVGVDVVFVPSILLPEDPRPLLDRFIAEVTPALRGARA
jgi:F420-dependent oxidoreductase-like protein